MTQAKVLVLGSTGYAGGPVASRLIDLGYAVTAQVRNDDSRAEELRKRGAQVTIGTLDSTDLIKEHAARSHAVFTCANNAHLPSALAVLEGFKQRHSETGKQGILVHLSGTGIFAKPAGGAAPDSTGKDFYSDLDIDRIVGLGTAHPQRKVHVAIEAASDAGYVRSYIILPSTIFGVSSLKGVESIFNKHSNQMPSLIRGSIRKKQAGLVGEHYLNTWPLVHTDDLTDLFELVLTKALKNEDAGNGRNGYYVAENGQYVGVEAAKAVGKALYARKLSSTAEPASFTPEEMEKTYGAYAAFAGTNCQATGGRSRQLGWKPRYSHADLIASLDPEVESIYKEEFQ